MVYFFYTVDLSLQMDPDAIKGAADQLLQDLGLRAKGDICALRSFCNCSDVSNALPGPSSFSPNSRTEQKRKLLAILQSGKKSRLNKNVAETAMEKDQKTKTQPPVTIKEKTRRVQLGWLHFNEKEDCFIAVRTTRGGGTRNMDFPAGYKKDDVLQAAIKIFFENGSSTFGSANDMNFDIANFKLKRVNDVCKDKDGNETAFTVQSYFESYKLSKADVKR